MITARRAAVAVVLGQGAFKNCAPSACDELVEIASEQVTACVVVDVVRHTQ